MAKNSVTDWDTTAASNTDVGGVGIQDSSLVSAGDDAFREIMAQIADVSEGNAPVKDTWTFADPSDLTKRVRLDAGNVTAGQTRVLTMPDANVTISSFAATLLDDADAPAVRATIGAQLEPGFLGWFAANSPPTGWLKANGAAVDRTTYAALFAAIGTTFGVGDGSTTFDLPDLRGEFLRGWDDGRGVDSSRVFGSTQSDAFQGHMHDLLSETSTPDRYINGSTAPSSPVNFSSPNTADVSGTPGTYRLSVHNPNADGVNGTPRTAAETRPRNVALLACIKY